LYGLLQAALSALIELHARRLVGIVRWWHWCRWESGTQVYLDSPSS
jgi:hypothetical protein